LDIRQLTTFCTFKLQMFLFNAAYGSDELAVYWY